MRLTACERFPLPHSSVHWAKIMRLRNLLFTFLVLILSNTLYAGDWQPDPGFRSLFNGKDLTGWCFLAKGMRLSSQRSASQYQANMHSQPTTRFLWNG